MEEYYRDPALVDAFIVETEELLQSIDQDLVGLEHVPGDDELLNRVFRALHSIKGTAGFLGFAPIIQLGHHAEDVLNALRRREVQLTQSTMNALLATRDRLGVMVADLRGGGLKPKYEIEALLVELDRLQKPQAAALEDNSGDLLGASTLAQAQATMRVDVRKIDDLINLIGELVVERNRLLQLTKTLNSDISQVDSPLSHSASRLSFITEELQAAALRTRMVPISTVFCRFPRLVRDLAQALKKETRLIVRGEETEIDRTLVELVSDPLVHLIRNALDHGLESPEMRESGGKPRQGTICIEATQEGDQILVTLSDDGSGIDPARILGKAIEMQIVTAERAASLSERETLNFIFLPGFSTADKATDVSGRGVGMDVVRTNLKKVNGSIEVHSKIGRGTTVVMHLPLTLAVVPVLLVQAADDVFALPLRAIVETDRQANTRVHLVDGCEVVRLRGETLPLLRLRSLCPLSSNQTAPEGKIVVLEVAEKRFALLVDGLAGQESTVIKPLGSYLHDCTGIAGATVSGDGRVRLVLDPGELIAWAANRPPQAVVQ
jgi:two-component system chemotaxis sensor kinase CheA